MKSPFAGRAAPVLVLALICVSSGPAAGDLLGWVNALRAAAGSPSVRADALLSRTALDWARVLAATGRLSHRSADGTGALDRYRARGGTEVRIGEIIGAGPKLSGIEMGWERSPSHRRLVTRDSWTHAGYGESLRASGGAVWVVLFCQKQIDGLRVEEDGEELVVSGRFLPAAATGTLLLAGLDARLPESWDPASRTFTFRLAMAGLAPYIRLGFVTADGGLRLTNAFTLGSR